jgi:hypothetical protein
MDAEVLFNRVMEEVISDCEKTFSAEEGNGKYVDLHNLYLEFINIKKVSLVMIVDDICICS